MFRRSQPRIQPIKASPMAGGSPKFPPMASKSSIILPNDHSTIHSSPDSPNGYTCKFVPMGVKTGYCWGPFRSSLGISMTMLTSKLTGLAVVLSLVGTIAGCATSEPYVHGRSLKQPQGSSETETTDRTEVTVCYTKYGTSLQSVSAVAKKECARSGKSAVFKIQTYEFCPFGGADRCRLQLFGRPRVRDLPSIRERQRRNS